jgi:hypothetical protein
MEKIKLYYDSATGYLCNRYPKDISVGENTPYIEVSEEEAEQTYACEIGKFWAVVSGKLQLVDDKEYLATDEYKRENIETQILKKQEYLNNTDYIIVKINEARIDDDLELEQELKTKYATELATRKQYRQDINDLEEQLALI